MNLHLFLKSLTPATRLCVAYSGGVDSHVLLHALHALQSQHDFTLRAVHIHHQLNPNADQWQQHAINTCLALCIPLDAHAININAEKGDSIEEKARVARYAYFAEVLQEGEMLCTAHHEDDQAETFLLQLLRGAGPKGLAAMPALTAFAKGKHARPLLNTTREAILQYAAENKLHWIEDDSNTNTQFDRNFLRHNILPLLKKRYPAAAATIARSANHCASTQHLFEDYLKQDISQVKGELPHTLSRKKLAQFTVEKQYYLFRMWMQENNIQPPNKAQLSQIQHFVNARQDAESEVNWGIYSARFYRDNIFIAHSDFFKPAAESENLWDGKTILKLPEGELSLSPNGPLSARILEKPLTVRFRTTHDSHKKIFQNANIPTWQRWQLPFIYIEHDLVAIANIYTAPAYVCRENENGLQLSYQQNT